MRGSSPIGLALAMTAVVLATPSPAPAADLDLRGDYAKRRCHGPGDAGESLSIGRPGHEAKAIAATNGRVTRKGAVLTVGKVRLKTQAVDGDDEDAAEYEYLGGWDRNGVEVVFVMRYEDMAWRLVDPRSGQWADMGGPPLVGPSGKTIAAVGDDTLINEFNGVEIVEHRDGKFVVHPVDADYACDPVWLSDEVLQLKVLSPKYRDKNGELLAGALPPSAWRTTQVTRKNGEWRLTPPKP